MQKNAITTGFDIGTLLFYLILAVGFVLCLHQLKGEVRNNNSSGIKSHSLKICYDEIWMIVMWIILVFAAVFRLVNENGVGGPDASEYIRRFQYGWTGNEDISLKRFFSLKNGEPFLYSFFEIIRLFTSSYRIMFLIFYGFVGYCYLSFSYYFFKKYRSYVSFVGAPLLIKEFLYSFSAMRFSLGVAFILLGMKYYGEKRYRIAGIYFICAILSHLTLIIPVGALVFERVIGKTRILEKLRTRRRMVTVFAVVVAVLFLMMPHILNIIMNTKFGYANNGGLSIRGQLIFLFTGLLTLSFYKELKAVFREDIWIVDLELLDVALIPIMLNVDAYRIHNMFVGVKAMILGALFIIIRKRFANKRIVTVGGYLLAFAYFCFLFYRGSMPTPYILDMF